MNKPLPLEQTDPELAEHIRQVANKEHPVVKVIYGDMRMIALVNHKNQVKRIIPERNEQCFCGSEKKFKKCHGK